MKVSELIAILQTLDPSDLVVVSAYAGHRAVPNKDSHL